MVTQLQSMMNQQQSGYRNEDTYIPLPKWVDRESKNQIKARQIGSYSENHMKQMILRKTTVAYGIAELLRDVRTHPSSDDATSLCLTEQCSMCNFVVRVSNEAATSTSAAGAGQLFIEGVDMISPQRSVNLVEPSFLSRSFSDDSADVFNGQVGRYLEAEFPSHPFAAEGGSVAMAVSQSEEDVRCLSLGALMYELLSHLSPPKTRGPYLYEPLPKTMPKKGDDKSYEPSSKKTRLMNRRFAQETEEQQETKYVPLVELGLPSSMSVLVKNLLECEGTERPEGAYDSLDEVIKDLHLLLLEPAHFLFDHTPPSVNGKMQLEFRKHQLYGRENEVSLITDAFCRVSGGKSEAFFIGGFSGSGKSMLVNSLTARVDIAEGYVLTHKFDQMSKERPLLEVISAFNNLCLLVQEKSSQHYLQDMAENLMYVFGADFHALARLLPNIHAICPQFKQQKKDEKNESYDQMNLKSVCFILQRFMGVVSSKAHPVMLFLDDLQWCDNLALTVIEGILSDFCGSSCLFFVGSYRNNEVKENHAIFQLMDSLQSSGVPITKLSLEGLRPDALNTMISDAICMFPRTCEPLRDIVFQKTKGNPYFVLEFLRSLVDRGLLKFSVEKKRWVWDEDQISSMGITGNVLFLLSSKMSGMTENIQFSLKVTACFGIKMNKSVVGYLRTVPEYAGISDGLEQAVKEGFITFVGTTHFRFVHDKVREAAYSLIPDNEKNQFNFNLGMVLYSLKRGTEMDDILFSIADQINCGIDNLPPQRPELRIEIAELNELAGVKAINHSDFATASSYLRNAFSLLPSDRWISHYDTCLRLSTLMAKSYHSSGDGEKACDVARGILSQAQNLNDKLGAYHLIVEILYDREELEEAYNTNREVLLQLGEKIPDELNKTQSEEMVKTTSEMLNSLTEESLLGMKSIDDKKQSLLKLYVALTAVSFAARPKMVRFFICRMIQLTMNFGVSKYSIVGFVQFAAMGCSNFMINDIKEACRIGQVGMALLKRFDSSTELLSRLYMIYYGFVAPYTMQLQLCADNLRRGFECGIASGDTTSGGLNAIHHIRLTLLSGIELPTILKRIDYYMEVMKRNSNTYAMTYIEIYRGTVSLLIGHKCDNYSVILGDGIKFPNEMTYFHKAMRAYWIGHSERCHHFGEKLMQEYHSAGRHHRNLFMMYYGLNSFKVIRRSSTQKLKSVPRNCLQALKAAMKYSRWNFCHKVHLLEAEIFSNEGRNEDAKESYAAAVLSARSSKFLHEQGLACELAGFHYKKIGDQASAWCFFSQAKHCYTDWGSQVKIHSINRQLEGFQTSSA